MQNLADNLFDKLDTHRLPSVDQVLVEIIQACSHEGVTFDKLAELMGADPALMVKVLTIANSPVFYPVRRIVSLHSALITLGMETIKTLVMTASLRQVLESVKVGPAFNKKRYWKKSLYCGLMVKELVGLIGYSRSDEAYLAGMLHNIGELVIASNFPAEIKYCKARNMDEQLVFEQRQFGFNRYDVGAWLVAQWDLHPFISDAIRYQQESPEQVVNGQLLVRLVYLASHLSVCETSPGDAEFDLADRMFGLSPEFVVNICKKVEDEVARIARSMSIELSESNSGTGSQPNGVLIPNGGIISGTSKRESGALFNLVRERALADSVRPLIDNANDLGELIESLRVSTFVLFGSKNTLLFVSDPERTFLTGVTSADVEPGNPVNQIDVLLRDDHSVIATAFRNNAEEVSLVRSKQSYSSIVDRQIIRLFSSDALYCIPISDAETTIGVMVLAISETRVSEFKKNRWLLKALGSIVAKALYRIEVADIKNSRPARSGDKRLNVQRVRSLVHEANNPLTVLKNYVSILTNKLEDGYHEELRVVRDEIDRVGRIIRQITDETKTNEDEVNINNLIADLLKIYQASYSVPRNVTLNFIPDEKLPVIKVNPDLIKQVLTNLIKNALEAMTGGGMVKITTKREFVVGDKRYLEIVVSDSGPGMPEDLKAQLFKHPVSTKGDARGYGLTIVKNLLREIGGLINVKSREQMGTSFQILLPIRKVS